MSVQPRPAESHDPRIDAALAEYLEHIDQGQPPNTEEFVAQHPEIADELRSLIAAEADLRKLAGEAGDRADSTKSFALHGQETIAPQAQAKREGSAGTSGLKEQFGRYRIVRVLGQGAMGTVYLAEDTQLKRQVALKTPHFDKDSSGELLERLYREARAAATLRHPNICPVHDVGQIDGTHYISMAYIEGHPLSAFIRANKPQPERQILIVVRKLAQALQEAHDQKIVHRDLKPANIMVDKRGEPLIMDFGLARQVRPDEEVRLTHSGMLVGTPAYMSPEQVGGEPDKIGPLTDEYSLGVILYELLTGQLPFRGSMMAVLGQIVTKDPTPLSQLRPGLDPRIEAACSKMMAKEPADRFPSLAAVTDELATILKNPGARPAASGKSTAAFTLPAPVEGAPLPKAGTSQILKSQKQKSLTASDLESLEELVRKCWSRHDYDQAIQIVERIPEEKRNANLQTLLEKAHAKSDEIAFLLVDIDEAVRLEDGRTALKKAEALLKIKPGHHRALEVQQQFGGEGDGGSVRLGPKTLTRDWTEGGWIPWSALAFGVAVVGVVAGVIIIWLGKNTAIVIDSKDPGITVEVNGEQATIKVPGEQSIKVEPGDGAIKVSYAGMETETKRFRIRKGETKRLTVAIVDNRLAATLQGEILTLIVNSEKARGVGNAPAESSNAPVKSTEDPPTTTAAPVATASPMQSDDGFVPLFNGKDKTGWKIHPSQPGNWRVEKGILIGSGTEKSQPYISERSHLYTERGEFKDFHLRVEARINDGGNSGLYFRSTFGPGWPADHPKWPYGYEAQIDSTVDPNRTGSLFAGADGLVVGVADTLVPPGQWFTEEVIAQGNRITVKLNGQTTAVYRDEKEISASGHIALQLNNANTVAEFRKIEIKEFPPDVPAISATASQDGLVPLFNGKDLSGWARDPRQPGDWRVRDGILSGGGPSGPSTLYSERTDYRDFHLRVDARLTGDASSGLCFRTEMPPPESQFRTPTSGFEVELTEPQDRNATRTGSVYGLGSGGSDGQTHTGFKYLQPIIEEGKWFTVDVFAEGLHTVVKINGRTTLDNHWGKQNFRVGRIALQQQLGKPSVEFRKIEIKELQTPRGPAVRKTAPAEHTTPSAADGYVPLFNGTDLTGWKTHIRQPGNWLVRNGILIGSGSTPSHLYTKRGDFKDFDLRLEARINVGGNSGVVFRSQFGPAWPANKPKFPLGYEAQIDSTSHTAKTGSLFVISGGPGSGSAVVSIPESPIPAGEWFTMEVSVKATDSVIKVNGSETAQYSDSHFKRGHIALQQHDAKTVVEFRKIEIRETSAKTGTLRH